MEQLFDTLYNVIAPILLVIAVGLWFGRRFNPDQQIISALIVYLFAPALVFRGLATTTLTGDVLLQISLHIGVVSGLLALIGWGTGRLFNLSERETNALILSVILFNGANYGLPFNIFAYGESAGDIAIVYYSLSIIVANTAGVYFASRGTDTSTRAAMLNIFRVPLLYASVLGLLFNAVGGVIPSADAAVQTASAPTITLPVPLARMIDLLADATIPMMIVLIGIQFGHMHMSGQASTALVATGIKLVVSPLLAFAIALVVGLEGLVQQVAITQFAMPTAIIASALATQFGGDAPFVTRVTVFSTLISILSLSLLVAFIGG